MACNCKNCNTVIDGYNGKMVILVEQLWLSIANKKDILCDTCIEVELGRKIRSDDLKYGDAEYESIFHRKRLPVNEIYAQNNGLKY